MIGVLPHTPQITQLTRPGPIFTNLRLENPVSLPLEQYERVWQELQRLGQTVGKEYTDFLTYEQGLITLKFLKGENVFGVLPTSGGKSLTFQLVARLTDGLTLVISPLIALMRDYPDGEYFNSELEPDEKAKIKQRIREGRTRLLYISPERLKSTDFKDLLDSGQRLVKRVVIDEAHCVVEWGYSFRAKYLHIAQEIEAFESRLPDGKKIPILLLTATASPWLQRETAKNLRVEIPVDNFIIQKQGADRPELIIKLRKVATDQEKIRWLANQLKRGGDWYGKRGIIFSAFADGGARIGALNAPSICAKLENLGVDRIDYYHGQMSLDKRREVQSRFQTQFQKDNLNVIVATKAFGMGIDLPKLDFIVHFYPPISLEEYWQEVGRGGRGMNTEQDEYCQCVVLHKPSDYDLLQGFPNLASFEKILGTFTTAAQGELCFEAEDINPSGRLRKLLTQLQRRRDVRKMPDLQVDGINLERWQLNKSADQVVAYIEDLFSEKKSWNTKQTRRLRNNLRLCAGRVGDIIRVEHNNNKRRTLEYYELELNWFTEPEIGALEMIDDEPGNGNGVRYSCFRLIKDKLSLADMETLAYKVNTYRENGYAKLNFVFENFLQASRTQTKAIILDYLNQGHNVLSL